MVKVPQYYKRSTLIFFETLTAILVVLAFIGGIGLWRLKSGPVDIDFARDYIEQALQDEKTGTYLKIKDAALYWPDLDGPLLLGVQEARIFNNQDRELISLEELNVSLDKLDLLIGKITPTSLIIKRPTINLIRREDNTLDFGFQDWGDDPTIQDQQESFIEQILTIMASPDGSHQDGELSQLKVLEIEDAHVIVQDYILEFSWTAPDFDLTVSSREDGLLAQFTLKFSAEKNENTSITADLYYGWNGKTVDFTTEIDNINTAFFASKIPALPYLGEQDINLNGRIQSTLSENLVPEHLSIDLRSDAGRLNIPALRGTPVPYRDMALEFFYSHSGRVADLTRADIVLDDIPLSLKGQARINEGPDNRVIEADANLTTRDLDHKKMITLWPESVDDPKAREWFFDKIQQAFYNRLEADAGIVLQQTQNQEWEAALESFTADFVFENASVDYKSPLYPVTQGTGTGRFDLGNDTLQVNVSSGVINAISVSEAKLVFTEVVAEGKGAVDMQMSLNGPLRNHLEYVVREPINLGDNLDFDIAGVKGDAAFDVALGFPTRDDVPLEEIDLSVSGTVRDIRLPGAVSGLDVTGGPLDIEVKGNQIIIDGQARIADRPATIRREAFLRTQDADYRSKTTLSMDVDPNIRERLDIDLSDFLEGTAPVNMIYTELKDGTAEAEITVDLSPARVFIDAFDFVKEPGRTGSANFIAHLKDGDLTGIKDLQAKGERFQIDPATLSFITREGEIVLDSGKLPRFVVGETIAGLEFQRQQNGVLKIQMDGPFLDARPFLSEGSDESESYNAPPMLVSIAADQMRTADGETVQYAKIYADINAQGAFNQFEVDAIAGAGDIYLRYKPDERGKRTFQFEADDAGATLKAFGVYDQIVGGQMRIFAEPIRGIYDRNLLGSAVITNFKVVDAPSLAQLLSALSLPGLLQNLNNDGLTFSKLEANFDWLYQPGGSVLVLKDGRTSGNELGLTFDGSFDNQGDKVDVKGTIIPLSSVNKIIGNIPVIGNLITGGTGSLIAATYTIKGDAEDPQIAVNPLSVLAPGILRRILFEN